MNRTPFRHATLALASITLFFAVSASAAEPPAMTFVKAKCALCHGKDGSGNTPAGKQSGVRSLKLEEVRNLTDAALASTIANGKGKMPAFKERLDQKQIELLVTYVRELGATN